MDNFAAFIIIIVVLGVLFYFFKDKIYIFFRRDEEQLPFKRKEFLMNIPERKFFEQLQQLIPDNYAVFPQIVLSSIVNITAPKNETYKYRNKINRKTIDFVIFEKPYYKPVIAIEYDGKTHNYPSRIKRDVEVKKILDNSGIKNFHVKHQKNINFEEIKNEIKNLLFIYRKEVN